MKYSKRVVYCLIAFIICINILYRYPTFNHEEGFDSFYLHNMGESISYYGYAKWIINPLSYFGMYAFSYPSAMPFMYSSISQVASVSIEIAILLSGIIFGLIGALFAYFTAKEIKDDDFFAFFTALTFSMAPFLLNITTWEGSSRGFVVTFLPFYIFLLVKHLKTANTKFLILALVVLTIIMTIHRLGYIAIFIFFAYLFTLPLHNISKYIMPSDIKFLRLKKVISFAIIIVAFLGALSLLFVSPGFLGSADINQEYSTTAMISGHGILTTLENLGISYTGKIGILVPLMILGIFGLAWQERRSVPEKFFILSLLFLMPFLPIREYMTDFFVAIFSILIGFSIYYLYRILRKRKNISIAVFLAIIVVTMGFSWEMKDYWHKTATYDLTTEQTYATGLYVKYTLDRSDMFIANKGYISLRVTAYSGVVSLPLGGASGASYNAQQLIYDNNFNINRDDINVKPTKIENIGYTDNQLFVFKDPNSVYDAELNWANVLDTPCDGPNSYLATNIQKELNIHYVLETHDLDGQYIFWSRYYSPFLGTDNTPYSVHMDRYKIYDNQEEAIWYC